jgi:uncharacterized protein (TIGR00269 family)
MFTWRDRIAVAVSGGKDSLSLLTLLAKIIQRHPKAYLSAITVDEGIKNYRDEALKFVKERCNELNVENHTVSFRELYGFTLDEIVKQVKPQEAGQLSPCAYCGILRRRALNVAAMEVGANKIATAHTLDDEAQTILMNFLRGDLQRLIAEKPVTTFVHPRLIVRVKPFCEIPEKETALYAYLRKIAFQSLPCPYAQYALRNDTRAILNYMEQLHPGTKFTVFRSAIHIRNALEATTEKKTYSECSECGEPTSQHLCKVCQMLRELKHE